MPEILGFAKKRRILYNKRTPKEELIRVGMEFLEADYFDDALEFFTRASATSEIEKVAQKVFEAGDVPLVMRARRALKKDITPKEWQALAERCVTAGRLSMAYLAYTNGGMPEKAEEIKVRQGGGEPAPKAEPDEQSPG